MWDGGAHQVSVLVTSGLSNKCMVVTSILVQAPKQFLVQVISILFFHFLFHSHHQKDYVACSTEVYY